MARYEHLPIYKAALDAAVHFENVVAGFSRYHKYALGTELRNASRLVVEQVIARQLGARAAAGADPATRCAGAGLGADAPGQGGQGVQEFSGLPARGGAGGQGLQTERGLDQECGTGFTGFVIPAQAGIQRFRTSAYAGVTRRGRFEREGQNSATIGGGSVPSNIIVRPSRLGRFPGMTMQGGVPARDSQPVGPSLLGSPMAKVDGQGTSDVYWSGLEYAPNTNNAWNFNTNDGNQNANDKNNEFFAWAVRPGE